MPFLWCCRGMWQAKGTTQEKGYGVSSGRPQGTTQEQGYGVSSGRPQGTTQEQGYGVSSGRPQGTTHEQGYGVSSGRPQGTTQEKGYNVGKEGGRPQGTTHEKGYNVGRGRPQMHLPLLTSKQSPIATSGLLMSLKKSLVVAKAGAVNDLNGSRVPTAAQAMCLGVCMQVTCLPATSLT